MKKLIALLTVFFLYSSPFVFASQNMLVGKWKGSIVYHSQKVYFNCNIDKKNDASCTSAAKHVNTVTSKGHFSKNGRYELSSKPFGTSITDKGTWKLNKDKLKLSGTVTYSNNPKHPKHIELTLHRYS